MCGTVHSAADVCKNSLCLQADVLKAQEIHADRINTRRSANHIGNEIEQIEKQIKTQEQQSVILSLLMAAWYQILTSQVKKEQKHLIARKALTFLST